MIKLIGISGKIGHGKDSVAESIQHQSSSPWINKKYASSVKDIASILTGIRRADFEKREFKESNLGKEWGNMPVREFLQRLGTDAIRKNVNPNAWINSLFSKYDKYCYWIVSDVRFIDEAEAIKDRGGIVIRVNRPGIKNNTHISAIIT